MDKRKKEPLLLFTAGALIGLCVFLLVYGVSPLCVTQDAFLLGGYVEQDIQQHYAGWMFYRDAPLSVPFCISPSINWPEGMSVAFTDSIPIFAVLFRLLSPLLPDVFQYFGLFTLLCFMLQGGFAALLVSLFSRNRLSVLLGTIPFVFSPILLERAFRHTSLAAHFLILAGLYYYIRSHRENRFAFWGLLLVNSLAITIHPYFVPMTFAITFAMLVEYAVRNRCFAKPFGWLAANLAGCFAIGWLFGVFSASGSGAGGSGVEYGYFSMNLNTLWNPTSRGVVWSQFLPVQNQLPGNYDGFNYLGLGMLLALGFSALYTLWMHRHELLLLVQRHWGLLFVSICLTLFAVSHIITANGATLIRLPLPQFVIGLATTLRSSGRMFWPVYYLLFLFAVRGLIEWGENCSFKHTAPAVLALLCVVQLADLSPALAQKADSLRHYQPLIPDQVTGTTPELCTAGNFFELTRGRYQKLIALDPLTHTGLPLALYSADNGMANTDTSFLARYNEDLARQQRNAAMETIRSGDLPTDSLFVTESEETFLLAADAAGQNAWCAALQADDGTGFKTVLYVIAPGFDGQGVTHAVPFDENFPVHLPDYSDDYWQHSILCLNLDTIGRQADQNKVISLPDTPYLRRKLSDTQALCAEGVEYPILKIDDTDPGLLMLTLDIEDAHILIEKDLTFVP